MLTTLLRFDLHKLWEFSTNDGLRIGIGFPIVLWLLIGTLSVWRMRKAKSSAGDLIAGSLFWLAIPVCIVVVSKLKPDLAPNGVPVFAYGFMMFVGFLVAIFSATRRAKLVGLNPDVIMDMGMWLLIPGIIGARSFYLMQYHERVFGQARGFRDVVMAAVNLPDGGLVFYGGLIAGILGFVAFCFRHKLSMLLMADTIVPSLFIGLGFGRIGCFLYGCCFGDRCDLPWAVRFPVDSMPYNALLERGFIEADAPSTFALHPSQLYSSASAFVLAGLLAVYFRHRPWNGAVLAVAWILYPINRFVLEFLRGDELGQFNTSLTISQLVSMGLLVSGIAFLVWMTTQVNRVRPVRTPLPPVGSSSPMATSPN
jgi:phosphatidylglycerol:prolipoprotein diacylglycerol transferase